MIEVHETGSEIIYSEKEKNITLSTDCQLVSVERLGWRRRLFEQKRHWHCQPSSLTPELPIYPLPLNTHTRTHTH